MNAILLLLLLLIEMICAYMRWLLIRDKWFLLVDVTATSTGLQSMFAKQLGNEYDAIIMNIDN